MAAERQGWGNNHSEWFFFSFSFLFSSLWRFFPLIQNGWWWWWGGRDFLPFWTTQNNVEIPAAITFIFPYLFFFFFSRYWCATCGPSSFFLPAFSIELDDRMRLRHWVISQTTLFFDFCVLRAFWFIKWNTKKKKKTNQLNWENDDEFVDRPEKKCPTS